MSALLQELKDPELIALALQNAFKIVSLLPFGRRAFTDKVIPALREVYLVNQKTITTKGQHADRDTSKDAGMAVIMENMNICVEQSASNKDFKDGLLNCLYFMTSN